MNKTTPVDNLLIRRLVIIGVGLIGGSLARILRQQSDGCGEIIGCGRGVANLQTAVNLGVIDRYTTDIAEAVIDADMIVVAVPLGAMAQTFAAMLPNLAPHAIVTDVGSAKGSVVADARAQLANHLPYFVPGHPIAGTEKSGVTASFAELFQQRRVILTPLPETDQLAHAKVRQMWELAGAEVVNMDVSHHDEVLAATSHLPHILAYSLVDTLAKMEERAEIFRFSAGGFRDFSRIASSDPQMWHDICLSNREAVLHVLDLFSHKLQDLTAALEQQDSKTILEIFRRAKTARDKLSG
jgi:prephenate dehydrogenase